MAWDQRLTTLSEARPLKHRNGRRSMPLPIPSLPSITGSSSLQDGPRGT